MAFIPNPYIENPNRICVECLSCKQPINSKREAVCTLYTETNLVTGVKTKLYRTCTFERSAQGNCKPCGLGYRSIKSATRKWWQFWK